VHLELSSMCNARCPLCPRNFFGFPYNRGYVETNLQLEKLKFLLPIQTIQNLDEVLINGNYGDFVMNPESLEIITWLRSINSKMKIHVSTNGGARDKSFWSELAKLNLEISFCIDGLEDTHAIYRQDTSYEVVIKNARTFIKAGGYAIWTMTEFEHNYHEFDKAKALSRLYGFRGFNKRVTKRDKGPIYDRNGNKIFVMKNSNQHPDKIDSEYVDKVFQMSGSKSHLTNKIIKVSCESKNLQSIYISSQGHITPCCYTALYNKNNPEYYSGIDNLLSDKTLDHAIESFDTVEKSFNTNTLKVCERFCQC
jgi:MoaA/NifB/PqqE/SkfB family radical SAM enzyme